MGLAGDGSRQNLQAISYLALILSISVISFVALTVRPNPCFPGDIGTTKCPLGFNFAGTGPTASGQGTFVVPSTVGAFNCTGLTTNALTIKSTGKVNIWGAYSAASVNVTNWFMWVLLSIGTNPPSTSFGGAVCSTPSTCRWISSMYLQVTGVANWFTVTFAQNTGTTFCPALTVGNTYYAWIDLEARSVNTGHVSLRNEIQNAGSLFMEEHP